MGTEYNMGQLVGHFSIALPREYAVLDPVGLQFGEDRSRGTKELTRGRAPALGRVV